MLFLLHRFTKNLRQFCSVGVCITVLILIRSPDAFAQTWNSTTSTDWFTPENWSPSGVPTSADNVTITLGNSGPVISAPGAMAGFLEVGGSAIGTLSIQNGGTLSDGTGLVGTGPGISSVFVTGTGSTWNNSSLFLVADAGMGTVTVSNGGTLTMGSGSSSYLGIDGTGILNVINNGSFTVGSESTFYVGYEGTGTITINKGSFILGDGSNLYVGYEGGTGALNVTNNGTLTTGSGGTFIVGAAGNGTLNISNGGHVGNGGRAYIGIGIDGITTVGTATITSPGSSWTNADDIIVGASGDGTSATGTLTIQDGGVVTIGSGTSYTNALNNPQISTSTLYLGQQTGSTGVLNIGSAPGSAPAAPGTLVAKTVAFGAGTGTINFNHTGSVVFLPSVVGSGAINFLAGGTMLAGNMSAFTGTLNVASGAALSTPGEQQASLQPLANHEQASLIESRSTANELLGMTRPMDSKTYAYAGGMFGSSDVMFAGQYSNEGVTLLGGFAYGSQDYPGIEQSDAPIIALAGRYTFDAPFGDEGKVLHPYVELGGWSSSSETLTPERSYTANGTNFTGAGSTSATSWSEYGRLGMIWNADPDNTLMGFGEIGQQALSFGAYSEGYSSSNPFPATVGSGVIRYDVARFGGSWTRDLEDLVYTPLSVTFAGAAAHAFDARSGLSMAVDGINLGSASGMSTTWGEFGARINAMVAPQTTFSFGVVGTAGAEPLGTSVHGDIGISYSF